MRPGLAGNNTAPRLWGTEDPRTRRANRLGHRRHLALIAERAP